MSEKLLELSSVVNVLSRTVGDMERQRQNNETRSMVMSALVGAILNALPDERRAEVVKNFESAAQALIEASTSASRQQLKNEIGHVLKMLGA